MLARAFIFILTIVANVDAAATDAGSVGAAPAVDVGAADSSPSDVKAAVKPTDNVMPGRGACTAKTFPSDIVASASQATTSVGGHVEQSSSSAASGLEVPNADTEKVSQIPASSRASPGKPATSRSECETAAKAGVIIAKASTASVEVGENVVALTEAPPTAPMIAPSDKVEASANVAASTEHLAPAPAMAPSKAKTFRKRQHKATTATTARAKEAIDPWWPAKAEGRLNLTFAGQTSFTSAIALLFDGAFENSDSANKNIVVTAKGGGAIRGRWVVSANKNILLFRASPGRYEVRVGKDLKDSSGRMIAAAAHGPVQVAY